jgi:oligopeptidase B
MLFLKMTKPPIAPVVPHVFELHRETIRDSYAWLRDKSNPEVIAHLEAENTYTDQAMASTTGLQERLYQEMLGRIKETDLSVPYRRGEWLYYARTVQGLQYPLYCRKQNPNAPEHVVLDLNYLAEGKKFMALGVYAVSDDGRLLAFSTDETGFREYTLFVKNLETGELLPERIEKSGSVAWTADGRYFLYTVEDAAKRQYRIYRHQLGSATDDLIYEETDQRFHLQVSRSRSREWLFLTSSSHTASEGRCLRAAAPHDAWRLIAPREAEHQYDVAHRGDTFFIRSNQTGRNFALFTAPVSDPRRENWKEVIPHRPSVMLGAVELFVNHMVLHEREDGLPQLRIQDLRGGDPARGPWHRVAFPEPVYSAGGQVNAEFDTQVYRYSYESPVTPASVYDYDMETRQATLLKRTEVLGGYDASLYQCERIHATAADGTRIPISVVSRKDTPRDGTAAALLYGYGSYGAVIPAGFSSTRLSLLDRGIVYAIGHIRGGGEMGKPWHDLGRLHSKLNTFTDFIACAERLIAARIVSPHRLAAMGGSAGGLLMGAVVNMRPELFCTVVSLVPFVDVINTMLDESLPLTVGEFEEWGNPKINEDYEYLKRYCPYTNLASRAYPKMLVRTSLNDSQVMYWEPAKYVAKLRALNPESEVLFKINMAAGHGGASGRYDYLREVAYDYAFLIESLSAKPDESLPTFSGNQADK